jgi:hypothetical protein
VALEHIFSGQGGEEPYKHNTIVENGNMGFLYQESAMGSEDHMTIFPLSEHFAIKACSSEPLLALGRGLGSPTFTFFFCIMEAEIAL